MTAATPSPKNTPQSPQQQRVRRRGPGSIDTDHHLLQTPPLSSPTTPRSTLGSPLLSHAAVRRSGVGDLGAGPRRRISLSDVEVLPWLCCMAPAFLTFGLFGLVTFSALFMPSFFYWLTAYLTTTSVAWITCAASFALRSYFKLRQATKQDWQAMLEEVQQVDPDGSSVLHIVILPNYKESEKMLKDTIENLGRSPLASTRVRIVLAMEAREGQAAHEKANRLIQQTQHMFADIFSTFHPEGLPGEVPGKSSNTQWAYREALRHYGPILLGYDLSRVFVTVGDADTLWHPQYLSALTYSGLMMSEEERVWRIWQPAVLLGRNHFTVPIMTRATGMATIIFELFNLSCPQHICPSFAFSSYSLTLALASHPEVDGWDVDVIAEDYHMTCKCYFAALWELAHAKKDASKSKTAERVEIEPQLLVEPIFLPAVSYLVESSEGYWASVWARFDQAKRHLQGIVELGYILLQYARLVKDTGWSNIPNKTHWSIIRLALKVYILIIQTCVQGWSMIMAMITRLIPALLWNLWSGGIAGITSLTIFGDGGIMSLWTVLDASQRLCIYAFSQITGTAGLLAAVCSLVILDLVQGNFYQVMPPVPPQALSVAEGDHDDDDPPASGSEQADGTEPEPPTSQANQTSQAPDLPSFVRGKLGFFTKIGLIAWIFNDLVSTGFLTYLCYNMVPLWTAAWSLMMRGTNFEYIVASKPEE